MSADLDFWSDMLIQILWGFIDMIGVNRCETRVNWREEEISWPYKFQRFTTPQLSCKEKLFLFLMTQKSSQLLNIFQDKSASHTCFSNFDICTQCSDKQNNSWLYLTGFQSVWGQRGKLLKWEIDVIIKEAASNGVTQFGLSREKTHK